MLGDQTSSASGVATLRELGRCLSPVRSRKRVVGGFKLPDLELEKDTQKGPSPNKKGQIS